MNKLVGVRWGDLREETKNFLLGNLNVWEDIKDGECIFDLTDSLSVAGYIKRTEDDIEYIVDDEAIIYNPSEGLLLEAKELKLEIDEVMTVNEAAEIWGKAESTIRSAINSKKFVPGVDYRKAGRITLITKEAMERIYGEKKCHKE
ncbi:helix-turn-helix domain-containing protein [Clostridium sp. DSM 100503]|uniref:helix-turn-helix domain-containing protein n=1 Tax=Clostridium sp. DSM 100503 TaxID=2963282 RepID=UPI00214A427B|nr:helix-turn-helix domain-containing protein [Clostridium sp. DSM 100503]MCR1953182.1 helix-turn-helix domain-containing protein [Clostridium sp. DSM 100503]